MTAELEMQKPQLVDRPATLGQALLFSRDIEQAVMAEERQGHYTAARLRSQRPQAYAAIIDHLGAGVGMLRIGKLLGVHHLTVAAVRDAEPEQIDMARGRMVADLRHVARLQIERLKEDPHCVPGNVAGMLIDQVIRNAELLDGRVTSRTEHVDRIDIHSNFEEFLVSHLPSEKQLEELEVRVIDSTGGKMLAIEPPSPTDRPARTDVESGVFHRSTEGPMPVATTVPTTSPPTAGSPDARGGGGRLDPTGVPPK